MQLELTLHSHEVFWGEQITVLYTATQSQYQEGYDQLATAYPHVTFIPQDNFKAQVVAYVKRTKYPVFFCDDDVMIRPPDLTGSSWQAFVDTPHAIACLSFRLDPKYTHHFETGRRVPVPILVDNIWDWRDAQDDWAFPMSVLGHIFRRADLLPLVETLIYNSPNQFESALADNPLPQRAMVGFAAASTINIPANMVQTTHTRNRAGNVAIDGLNQRFLKGERIDLDDVLDKTRHARSCFKLITFKYHTPHTVPVKDKQLLEALT